MKLRPKYLEELGWINFLIRLRPRHYKGINAYYKFKIEDTDYILAYGQGTYYKWRWFKYTKTTNSQRQSWYYAPVNLIDILDDPVIPTEILFELDTLQRLGSV